MRGWRGYVALAALGGLLASPAGAQTFSEGTKVKIRTGQRIGVVSPTDSLPYLVPGDGNSVFTSDIARDRDLVLIANNVMANAPPNAPLVGAQDSSAAVLTRGWSRMYLAFYGRPDADSTSIAFVALSWLASPLGNTDSISAFLPTELQADAAANVHVADTLAYSLTPLTAYLSTAQPGEIIVPIQVRPGGRQGILIPLTDRQGRPFNAAFTMFRARHLSSRNASYNAYPVGGPPVVSWRADLYGAR